MKKVLTARIIQTLIVTLSLSCVAVACASMQQSEMAGLRSPATSGEACKEVNADGTCKSTQPKKRPIETLASDRSSKL